MRSLTPCSPLISALDHSWLVQHKPTYEIRYPDDLGAEGSTARTVSLHSGGSNGSAAPQRAVLSRAVTEDPYAEDDQQPLRNPPPARIHLGTIAELSDPDGRPPGFVCEPQPRAKVGELERRSEVLQRAASSGQILLAPPSELQGDAQPQTQGSDYFLYGPGPSAPGPGPAPVPLPVPAASADVDETDGGGQRGVVASAGEEEREDRQDYER